MELNDAIFRARKEMEDSHSPPSACRRIRYLERFETFANEHGYAEPSQELYDEWLSSAGENYWRQQEFRRIIKRIDRITGTLSMRPDGHPYNRLPLFESEALAEMIPSFETPPSAPVAIVAVAAKAYQNLASFELSQSTLGQYTNAFMEIGMFFMRRGTEFYDPAIFLEHRTLNLESMLAGRMPQWKWKLMRRAADALELSVSKEAFDWEDLHSAGTNSLPVPETLKALQCAWNADLAARNLSQSTMELHDYVFRIVLIAMGVGRPEDLCNTDKETLVRAMQTLASHFCAASRRTIMPIARKVLQFLSDHSDLDPSFSGYVLPVSKRCGHDSSYLAPEDEERLVTELENMCFRDRAIVLLALRLGLRNEDICGLRLDALDWKNDVIRFTQHKTGEENTLPLLAEVGNALMHYILEERPNPSQTSPYVFLRKQPPYQRMTKAYHIVRGLLDRLPAHPVSGQKRGPHMLRETFSYRLLKNRTSLPVISSALGHVSPESAESYVSMDEEMLRACALGFGPIPIKHWGPESEVMTND